MAANNVAVGNVASSIWPTVRVSKDRSDEATDNPLYADDRNFYKVEKSTKDGTKVDRLLYAGNNLEKAREIVAEAIKHGPRTGLSIRQSKQ